MLNEFKAFVTRGNLIEIAVGLIMALAFTAVVTAFTDVLLSLVAAIFGGEVTFDQLTFTLNGTPIPYGAFLTAVANFLIVAWILFLIVRAYQRMRRPEEQEESGPSELDVLTEIRDELRARRA